MQIENAIRMKTKSWTLVRKSAACNRNLSYLKYQSGKQLVYVFIFPQKSLEEATAQFSYLLHDEVLGEVDVIAHGWRNSKEENRIWKDRNSKTSGVDLKKGQVVVRIHASTLNLSREFAEYIGDLYPTHNTRLELTRHERAPS